MITFSLASVPHRVNLLRQVVARVLPQCDRLHVFLNGYADVPSFLRHEKITVARSQDHGDIGDNGKFFWGGETEGYCFTLDDDVLPCETYAEEMIRRIERFDRRAVIANHGSVFHPVIGDYFRDRDVLQDIPTPSLVNGVGTGSIAWHSDTLRVSLADFPVPNMTDVWFAILAKRQGVPLLVGERRNSRITVLRDDNPGLYERFCKSGTLQTAAIRANGPWENPGLTSLVHHGDRCYVLQGFNLSDHILKCLKRRGQFYEWDLLEAMQKLRSGGVWLDIGANIGNHAVFFAAECAADLVVAVEPYRPVCDLLRRNLQANVASDRFRVVEAAVYCDVDSIGLAPGPIQNVGITKVDLRETKLRVPAVSLDDLAANCDGRPISVIKIDVEGAELPVLEGGMDTIRRDLPLIACECQTDDRRRSVDAMLSPLGYTIVGRYGGTPIYIWEPGA